jgi:4-hydroxy-2-oxoheptanedioate aldolase
MKNLALARWRAGEKSVGAWSNLPDIHLAEVLARMDIDWICFDVQHGLMSYSNLLQLLPAISGLPVTPLVRVAANQPDQIGKALDAGAHGVIVPMVNNAGDARRAAEACRYPPAGNRSCGPMRDTLIHGFEYLAQANEQIACIVMIETEDGLANVEAIAATEGVDAIFVGPMDLCYGLGLPPGDLANPRFGEAITTILETCARHQRAAGIFGVNPEMAAQSLADGFTFVSASTDISFFRTGAAQAIATATPGGPRDGGKQKKSVY